MLTDDLTNRLRLIKILSGEYCIGIKTADGDYMDVVKVSYTPDDGGGYSYGLKPFFYPFNYTIGSLRQSTVIAESRLDSTLAGSYVELMDLLTSYSEDEDDDDFADQDIVVTDKSMH